MSTNGQDLGIDEGTALGKIVNQAPASPTSKKQNADELSDPPSPISEDQSSAKNGEKSSPTPEPEDPIDEPLRSHWYHLTTAQKNRCRQRIASWLGENYMVAPGVRLLVELVYQHYCLFCGKYTRSMPISQAVFERILTENFPSVSLEEEVERRPRKYFFYFTDLDIQESSEEFETVRKGRKVSAAPSARKRKGRNPSDHHTAKRNKAKAGATSREASGGNEGNQDAEEPPGGKTGHRAECATVSSVKWRNLAAAEKEAHREATEQWLEAEYEADSNVCMPRTAVFSHYLQHCDKLHAVPAPQPIFGRIIQKTFPRILMRRLGVRGESKYYYMGLDIRATSEHHADVSEGKVLSMGIKPKSNRLYLNTKT